MTLCQTKIQQPHEAGQLVCGLAEKGRVVSIFDKAVNILISKRLLVSLVDRPSAMTPMSVNCPDVFNGLKSQQLKLKVGDTVEIRQGCLTIRQLHIDTRNADCFNGIIKSDQADGIGSDTISNFHRILCLIGKEGSMLGVIDPAKIDTPFVKKAVQIKDRLLSCKQSRMAENLAGFVGLGTGFTPSGDDLICGFLLGEKVLAQSSQGKKNKELKLKLAPFNDADKKIILDATAGTNDGGRTLIWMALQGRFPRILLDAALGLLRAGGSKDILKVITAAIRCGHTSGTDALVGFFLYFQMAGFASSVKGNGLIQG